MGGGSPVFTSPDRSPLFTLSRLLSGSPPLNSGSPLPGCCPSPSRGPHLSDSQCRLLSRTLPLSRLSRTLSGTWSLGGPLPSFPYPSASPRYPSPSPGPLLSRALSRPLLGTSPLRLSVLDPLGVLSTQSHCLGTSRSPLSSLAVPVPPGVSSPQSTLSSPLPNSPHSGPPRPHSAWGPAASAPTVTARRPGALTSDLLSPPPGPAPPPPLPLPHLFLSRSPVACSSADPWVRSLSVGSGCAEPLLAISALRPTLHAGPRRPAPHGPSRGRRCCCPRCGSCQGWPIAPDCAEHAPPHRLSPPAPYPRTTPPVRLQ